LKTHNYYCIVEDNLSVYLPVRCYELTLKHRLLEQLGGFSHLLLDAMTLLPGQGVEWVLEVTGLSQQQLQPILKRMEGLGLIKGKQLNRQGSLLARWKRLIHGQKRNIWLDGEHKSLTFYGDATLKTTALHESEDTFVIRRWPRNAVNSRAWPYQDWNEDCELQKARIMRNPTEYLGTVFETFHDCFSDIGFYTNEWELSVWRVPQENAETTALQVPLNVVDLQPAGAFEYSLVSPVLCLETHYRLPDGAPPELLERQPENQQHIARFSSAVISTGPLIDEPNSTWCWPAVDAFDRQKATEYLFHELAHSTPTEGEVLFDRQHSLVERWQSFGFDWTAVTARLREIEGIHLIRGAR